ncbi:CocE/NonD family hydrolase [Candidatus Chloroploca sp. Khr17]|uniref:CocE/NonD family hydrolase n=1 Tax=Candidatus Chloroploca sp. Khr17 TaxID=2496869 RepID=UPI003511D365
MSELFAHPPEARYQQIASESRYLALRDGTQLALDLMLPADLPPGTRLPALMIMARYWRSLELRVPDRPGKALIGPREATPDHFLPRGFALVIVDARGTGASTGVCRSPFAPEESVDYAEVAAWVRQQPWCNGSLGAYGISYEGATALRLAAMGVQGVKGVIPQEIEYDVYADIALPGGILNAAFIKAWSDSNNKLDAGKPSDLFPLMARLLTKGVRPVDADRPTRTMLNQALAEHRKNTDVFAALSAITYRDDRFGSSGLTLDDMSVFAHNDGLRKHEVPIFAWGSWLDGASAESVLRLFQTFSQPQIAVIGAWKHEMTAHGSPFQKPGAKPDPLQAQQWAAMTTFFQHTLVDNKPPVGKVLHYYTLGEETWKQTDTFPLPDTQWQTWYFGANQSLSTAAPTEAHATDRYTVDFTATTGLTNRWHTQFARPLVYRDRAKQDRRLLTYTSAPLTQDLEVTGYPIVTLHVTSTEDDGAFFVYLEDIDPQGVVRYITEGQLRGIHRRLADTSPPYVTGMPYHTCRRADAAPLPRGEQVELVIGLQPTSVLFRRGHRIRVAIAGADKDTFARIPARATPTLQVARSSVAPSRIVLPVVSRTEA